MNEAIKPTDISPPAFSSLTSALASQMEGVVWFASTRTTRLCRVGYTDLGCVRDDKGRGAGVWHKKIAG